MSAGWRFVAGRPADCSNSSLLNRTFRTRRLGNDPAGPSGSAVRPHMSAYAPVPQPARNPKSAGLPDDSSAVRKNSTVAISVETIDGLDGVVERGDLNQRHGGSDPLEIAAIVGRHEECGGTSFLGCRDFLLNSADGLDISIGGDRSSAGEVPASQQWSVGDLVIGRQREDQTCAWAADLLPEVEGNFRVVTITGRQRDTHHREV